MKMRKCDRCGKIYEGLGIVKLPDKDATVTHMSFIGQYDPDLGRKKYFNKDLCQECLEGLVDYVYGHIKDAETIEYKVPYSKFRKEDLTDENLYLRF